MRKSYRIVQANVTHPVLGLIVKQNIEYLEDGVVVDLQFYSKNSIVNHTINPLYNLVEGQAIIGNQNDNLIEI